MENWVLASDNLQNKSAVHSTLAKLSFQSCPKHVISPEGYFVQDLKRVQSSLARGVNQENPRNQVTVTGIPEKVDKFPEGTVLGLI